MSSKFKVPTEPKPRVDERALASFSAGAESHSIEAPKAMVSVAAEPPARREKATETFLLRLTPKQMDMLNQVFEHTNVKSKQKLVEGILIPELERRAADLKR